jgi:hypothetical protein
LTDSLQEVYAWEPKRTNEALLSDTSDESEHLSLKEVRGWASTELSHVTKATELRLKEVLALVDAFSSGEISATEAGDRLSRYQERWGEALPGISSTKGMTDEDIVAQVDETHTHDFATRLGETTKRILREKKTGPTRL